MQRAVHLHQPVMLENFNRVDLGVVTDEYAAAQSKKQRCDVAVADRPLHIVLIGIIDQVGLGSYKIIRSMRGRGRASLG